MATRATHGGRHGMQWREWDAMTARATRNMAGTERRGVWPDAAGELVRDAVEASSWRRGGG